MKLEEIRNEVENLVDDPSYDADTIDGYINDCLVSVANLVNLPSLKRIGVVDTVVDQAYTNLTAVSPGFSGILRRVKKADGSEPLVYPDLERLLDEYGTLSEEGEVEAVSLEGAVLWYQKIPSSPETLTVLYFESPSVLAKDDDEPTDLPPHVHRKLLVHGAAYMIFDQIEDGVEGEKISTRNHFFHSFDTRSRESGINMIREWLAKTQPHHISSIWRY